MAICFSLSKFQLSSFPYRHSDGAILWLVGFCGLGSALGEGFGIGLVVAEQVPVIRQRVVVEVGVLMRKRAFMKAHDIVRFSA